MDKVLRSLIRISSFVRKEAAELFRQPRLVVTLILGPFLILLLFGLGYSVQPIPVRTLFVVPEDSVLRPYLEENARLLVKQLVYEGMTPNEELARARLRAGQVDLVVTVPDNIYETIRNSEQAVFTIYHGEIDPIRIRYAQSFADLFVNQVNQRVLQVFAQESQQEAAGLQPSVEAAMRSTDSLRLAVKVDDREKTRDHLEELDRNLTELETALLATSMVSGGLEELGWQGLTETEQHLSEVLVNLRDQTDTLDTLKSDASQRERTNQLLASMDDALKQFDTGLEELKNIDARVLIAPFRAEVRTIKAASITLVDYYVPGVIAVLLQHLCVTFGALSIVKERRSGTMELFQASPLSAFEVLLGKYVSYLLFTVVLSAILTGLLELTLGLPMLGSWLAYIVVVLALLYASLGLGFVLSLLANSTSQAVQYSMLALLSSVFFTGFFLNLELLLPTVRLISWAIPATYGIQLLQDIMLRGRPAHLMWLGILAAFGAGLYMVAWLMLHRAMART